MKMFLQKEKKHMDFKTAVSTCVKDKYMEFNGRASRSEYWYFMLGYMIVYIVLSIVGGLISQTVSMVLVSLLCLGVLLPSLAVGVRRLHDLNKSGWWLLIALVPLIGSLILLYFFIQKGTDGPNQYGADPLAA